LVGVDVPTIIPGEPDYYVYGGHRLSNYIIESDHVINIPVLKAHDAGYPQHEITTSLKNHYGSICPQNLCNNITGMLTLNADAYVKDKTRLVLTSALRGTYTGGPWEIPQTWDTFPEGTPNSLFFTTDPVTESYWARDMINAERAARGMASFACPWVEQASAPPYELGVSDPAQMTVVYHDPTAVPDDRQLVGGGTFIAPNVPNPFTGGTNLRLRLASAGSAQLVVVDVGGRVVRRFTQSDFPAGYTRVRWDGRDDSGSRLPSGVYFARLLTDRQVCTRRLVLVR